MKCKQCGSEFEGKFCPECGAKAEPEIQNQQQSQPAAGYNNVNSQYNSSEPVKSKNEIKKKKPIYKKWWFYLIIVVAVAAVFITSVSKSASKDKKIVWSDIELNEMLPELPVKKGNVLTNTEDEFSLRCDKISNEEYKSYVESCIAWGYDIDPEKDEDSYKAYNSNGYLLSLSRIGDSFHIDLNSPIAFEDIVWPGGTIGTAVPVPDSLKGKFSYEGDSGFFVYIGDTTREAYNDYVAKCSDAGFNVGYNKGDSFYQAKNEAGIDLRIEFEGNNTMTVKASASESGVTPTTEKTAQTTAPAVTTAATTKNSNNEELVDGMRKDFKEAMDSYESFMNEYVEFMKKYNANPSDLSLLADYSSFMSRYADFVKKFDSWENQDLNTKESAYYIDVQARVSKKLLEVADQ